MGYYLNIEKLSNKRHFAGIKTEIMLTYLIIPWSRVLLEKLTGLQLIKKFPAFYRTQRFITTFTSACQLLYPEPAQSSPYPHNPIPEDPS
jgi:hypothetical protein